MRELSPQQIDDVVREINDCQRHLDMLKTVVVECAMRWGILQNGDKILSGRVTSVILGVDGEVRFSDSTATRIPQLHSNMRSSASFR